MSRACGGEFCALHEADANERAGEVQEAEDGDSPAVD
jgi:hypothetical protein